MISHAYIWQNGENCPPNVLPAQLAVPWYALSQELELNPIICHQIFAMANWDYIDVNG